ncbi:MAG: FAD-dependent monooxygenase [Proteobacteria bacterium]|nr:FAD-dependent monooxygenase [Pseudomonadota bacterium]
MDTSRPFIAGGGIAGLAAALACARHGEVVLLERDAAFSEFGAGLQLGPNAVRALQAIGAWDAVEPITYSPASILIRDGVSGRLLRHIPLGDAFERQFGAPYRVAHRADLHAALLAAARSNGRIDLRTGSPAGIVRADGQFCDVSTGSGGVLQTRLLIAADGVGSGIRQGLFPGSPPVDSGLVFHRALLAQMPSLPGVDIDAVTLWLCPDGHVVHYPVRRARAFNIIHVLPARSQPSEAQSRYHAALQGLLNSVSRWTAWTGLHAPPLPSWQRGSAVLIGDAAHGTLPFLAQGAAMALEDAAALRHDPFDLSHLLARQSRVRRLHAATLATGRTYHLTGPSALARNAVIRLMPQALFMSRLAWIYRYAA